MLTSTVRRRPFTVFRLVAVTLLVGAPLLAAQQPAESSAREVSSRQGLIPNVGQYPDYVLWTWTSASLAATATESTLVTHERDAEADAWLPRLSIEWAPSGGAQSATWAQPLDGEMVYLKSAGQAARTWSYGRLELHTPEGEPLFSASVRQGRLDMSIGEPATCRIRSSKTPGVWHEIVRDEFTSRIGAFRLDVTRASGTHGALGLRLALDAGDGSTQAGAALPGLAWATFMGGSEQDVVREALLGADETVVAVGWTESPNYPTTPDALDSELGGNIDGLVTRVAADGSQLLSSSFLGGVWFDDIRAGELRSDGRVVVAGWTSSPEFPVTTGAFLETKKGVVDVFVTVLNPEANAIEASTFLGGAVSHQGTVVATEPRAIALRPDGGVVVAGKTSAIDFPITPGAVEAEFPTEDQAAFVTRLSPDLGHLEYSTFLGGSGQVSVLSVAVSSDGEATVVGQGDKDFPITPGTFGTIVNPLTSVAFIARLSEDGSRYVYTTVLNGFEGKTSLHDVVDAGGGEIVACGPVGTPDLPVSPDAFGGEPSAGICCFPDAYVLRIAAGATHVVWGSYLGGLDQENSPLGLAVGPSGVITVVGSTRSTDFPTTAGSTLPDDPPGAQELYVTRFHPDGKQLSYSTYLGGPGSDGGPTGSSHRGPVFLVPDGSVIVSGTAGPGFPTTPGAAFGTHMGALDGMVARLTMLPAGVERFGAPSPDELGGPRLSVHHAPLLDTTDFALLVTGAPPDSAGLLAFAAGGLPAPIAAAGAQLWLQPESLWLVPWSTDERGFSQARLAIPNLPALIGFSSAAQSFWMQPEGWVASDALSVVVGEG